MSADNSGAEPDKAIEVTGKWFFDPTDKTALIVDYKIEARGAVRTERVIWRLQGTSRSCPPAAFRLSFQKPGAAEGLVSHKPDRAYAFPPSPARRRDDLDRFARFDKSTRTSTHRPWTVDPARWPDVAVAAGSPARAAVARAVFGTAVARLPVRVRLPDGRMLGGGGPAAPVMHIHRPGAFFRRIGAPA